LFSENEKTSAPNGGMFHSPGANRSFAAVLTAGNPDRYPD
jgi:hypothetical protein